MRTSISVIARAIESISRLVKPKNIGPRKIHG
jgi:hypothetical protein